MQHRERQRQSGAPCTVPGQLSPVRGAKGKPLARVLDHCYQPDQAAQSLPGQGTLLRVGTHVPPTATTLATLQFSAQGRAGGRGQWKPPLVLGYTHSSSGERGYSITGTYSRTGNNLFSVFFKKRMYWGDLNEYTQSMEGHDTLLFSLHQQCNSKSCLHLYLPIHSNTEFDQKPILRTVMYGAMS